MTEEIREQLSALVDDELSGLEQPLLLGRLQRDPELRACLGRFQLVGEVMRGGGAQAAGLAIAARVEDALRQDETVFSPAADGAAGTAHSVWRPIAGFAIAASVALVAVLSIQNIRQTEEAPVQTLATSVPPTPEVVRVSDKQWNRIEPQVEKRLSGYLVNHNEFAASHGMQGVMPYVRIVGFEDE